MSDVILLFEGYSSMIGSDKMKANCSCTLIRGENNIIVDTMTAWDSDRIVNGLKANGVTSNDISYVVSTHGHSDHIGNNNLFLKAIHIVGFSVSFKDEYYLHPFEKGESYEINKDVSVIPTPGHTLSDVTVLVKTNRGDTVAITGDLFEKFEDIDSPSIWIDAGSESALLQRRNRAKVSELANWIIPGHGAKFEVTKEIRSKLKKQCEDFVDKF